MKTLLATHNPGKLVEVRRILGDHLGELIDLSAFPDLGEIPEDGDTFLANARQKAWTAARHTGLVTLADDSGLCVDALGGAPGVFSARYAGPGGDEEKNRRKLLEALKDVEPGQRGAGFVCVIVLANPKTGKEIIARGECRGEITFSPRGEGGFGYDPLFWVPEMGRTMAELSPEEKNRLSHRGKALKELLEKVLATSSDLP